MSRALASLITLAVLLCGCGTAITFTSLGGRERAARSRPADDVDVFLTEPPTRPHHDVGLLEAEQDSDLSLDDTRAMLVQLRKEAGRRGCDAIFIKSVGSNAQANPFASGGTSAVKTIAATCLRYDD